MEANSQSTYSDRLANCPSVPTFIISNGSSLNKHGYPVIDVAYGGLNILSILIDVTEIFCVRPIPKNAIQISFSVDANLVLEGSGFGEGDFDGFNISACMGGLAISSITETADDRRGAIFNKRLPHVTTAKLSSKVALQHGVSRDSVQHTTYFSEGQFRTGKQEIGRQMYGTSIHQLPDTLRGRISNFSHNVDIVMSLNLTVGENDKHSMLFTTSAPLVVNIISETVSIPTIKCIPLRRMLFEPVYLIENNHYKVVPTMMDMTHKIIADRASITIPLTHCNQWSRNIAAMITNIVKRLSEINDRGDAIFPTMLAEIDMAFLSYLDPRVQDKMDLSLLYNADTVLELILDLLTAALTDGHPMPSYNLESTEGRHNRTGETNMFATRFAGGLMPGEHSFLSSMENVISRAAHRTPRRRRPNEGEQYVDIFGRQTTDQSKLDEYNLTSHALSADEPLHPDRVVSEPEEDPRDSF